MKKILLTTLSLILGIIILGFAIDSSGTKNIIQIINSLNWIWLLFVPIFFGALFCLDTWRWQIILKQENHHVAFSRLLIAKFAGFAMCYITPMMYVGGEAAQAYILKKESDIPLTHGLSSIIIDKAIEMLMAFFFFIICGFLILLRLSGTIYTILAFLMIAVSLVSLGVFFYQIHRGRKFFVALIHLFRLDKIKFIARRKQRVEILEDDIYSFFKKNRGLLWKTLVISAISSLCYLFLFNCVFFAFGYNISFISVMILRSLAIIVSLIPIPAALGIYEGSFGFAFNAIGLDVGAGITFSLIMRTLYIIWTIIGFACISHFGIKLLYQNNSSPNSSSQN